MTPSRGAVLAVTILIALTSDNPTVRDVVFENRFALPISPVSVGGHVRFRLDRAIMVPALAEQYAAVFPDAWGEIETIVGLVHGSELIELLATWYSVSP